MVGLRLRRHAVVVMRSEVTVSERRASGLIQIDRRTYRYVPRPEDPRLRVRLRELAAGRRGFGYRRPASILVREGWKAGTHRGCPEPLRAESSCLDHSIMVTLTEELRYLGGFSGALPGIVLTSALT